MIGNCDPEYYNADPAIVAAFYADEVREPELVALALSICDGCPKKQQCLDTAMSTPEIYGIWGGTTESERKTLRRKAREANTP